MENNINSIISNALIVDNNNLKDNIKDIIEQIKKAFEINKDLLIGANAIDRENNNGFKLDFNVIDNIFKNVSNEDLLFGDILLSQKDDEVIYGKQVMDKGNVVLINSDPYVILEMSLRNIMAGNKTIFATDGYMLATSEYIINNIQSVLETRNISKNMIQIYKYNTIEEVLNNFANIDLVICIGDQNLQKEVLQKSKNQTIISGYENFDIYVESLNHKDFIDKIMDTGLNIDLYINEELDTDLDGMNVMDIDEAIGQINYNSAKYASAIFTDNSENASKFIKEVKSSIVTVNTSPTIERLIDIKQEDLVNIKTIIYPNNYKFDENSKTIEIKNET